MANRRVGDTLVRVLPHFDVIALQGVRAKNRGLLVRLVEELDPHRTVVLSFVFTACTAICPVVSGTLSKLQRRIGRDNPVVQLVSVSIDPDQDTPARLADYARKFDAGTNWHYYTGRFETSIRVQRAFDAYRGDKMNHVPDIYVRRAGEQVWVRLAGFASVDDLLAEFTQTPHQ